MYLTQLALQKQNQSLPTQLDFLRIIHLRGSSYFDDLKKRYRSIDAGNRGEIKVLEYIKNYGNPNWIVLRNVWLQDFNRFECDLILITKDTIYIFEIKNYKGVFSYENGKCYYDSIETSLNPIEQVRSNLVNLRKICSKSSINIEIKAAVIFAGEDHEININTPIEDIQIIPSNGIRNFIKKIAREERGSGIIPEYSDRFISSLNAHEIENPFTPKSLNLEEMTEIRPGICCANCQSFDVEITKFKVYCKCGLCESREEAIIRTICEYGVLNHQSNLTVPALLNFLNKQVGRNLLTDILNKHFTVVKNYRYTYYMNLKLPYEKLTHYFTIEHLRILYQTKDKLQIND